MKIHNVLYLLGFASIALSASQYLPSKSGKKERDGLFIGQWAPTFFILGKVMEDKDVQKRGVLE